MLLKNLVNKIDKKEKGVPEGVMLSSENEKDIYDFSEILNRSLSIVQKERINRKGYVHVSSIKKFCPRQYALALKYDVPVVNSFNSSFNIMWGIGRSIEKQIVNSLIDTFGEENVFARWSCECGRHYYQDFHRSVISVCDHCNTLPEKYNEAVFSDDVYGMRGSPDFLYRKDNVLNIVEIKSSKADTFNEVADGKSPESSYAFQVSAYYYLLGVNDIKVNPLVSVIYCNKEFNFKNPFYTQVIDARDYYEQVISAREYTKEFKDYVDKGKMPKKICSSSNCTKAAKCPLLTYCFV